MRHDDRTPTGDVRQYDLTRRIYRALVMHYVEGLKQAEIARLQDAAAAPSAADAAMDVAGSWELQKQAVAFFLLLAVQQDPSCSPEGDFAHVLIKLS